jgi:uncharacterized protein involved in type VI secretion and phage assembly
LPGASTLSFPKFTKGADMNLPENRRPAAPQGRDAKLYGVYPATVREIADPLNLGRVKVNVPALQAQNYNITVWARLATLNAGSNFGTWFIPDVDDEVLVAFGGGDPAKPFVIGSLWNDDNQPPEEMDDSGRNTKKSITTRNGLSLKMVDQDGQESITVQNRSGQKITLKNGPGSIEINDGSGNSIKLEASAITVTSAAKVIINASMVQVSAGHVSVDSGMTSFSGTVKCDTLIANSVASASYTPGAGNIW